METKTTAKDLGHLVRAKLAEHLGVTEEHLEPAALRKFFETKVPLGSLKGLTYFAMLVSMMWEQVEKNKIEELKNTIALSAVFCEQAAIDGGRFQLAWLLTGQNTPAFNLTTQNVNRIADEPFALLADPRWIAANLSFLKDLDYFESRQASLHERPEPSAKLKPKPKPKPRPKPKAKDKP